MNKLVKYELRSAIRQIGPIWAALLVMSIVAGLLGSHIDSSTLMSTKWSSYVFGLIPGLLFIGLFVACGVITIMIVVLRFYKGLLGEEGYMMHTLPVSTGKLVASKGVVSAIVIFISGFLSVLSIFIIASPGIPDFREFFSAVFDAIKEDPKSLILFLQFCLFGLLGTMFQIYTIYASMSIGQLSGKHRVLLSIGAFILLNTLFSTIHSMIFVGIFESGFFEILNNIDTITNFAWLPIIGMLVEVILLHVLTERILAKKLNLL